MTRLATPIFEHTHPKNFWSSFNLCEFVSTCIKSGYSIDLFWRYALFKNPANWFTENILACILGTKIYPNMGFMQEHSKQYRFLLYNKFSKNQWPIFQWIQKSLFLTHLWSIFPVLGAKMFFQKNLCHLSMNEFQVVGFVARNV